MDHCKDKGKHKWSNKYGFLVECKTCGRIKVFKTRAKGRKNAIGAFGKAAYA